MTEEHEFGKSIKLYSIAVHVAVHSFNCISQIDLCYANAGDSMRQLGQVVTQSDGGLVGYIILLSEYIAVPELLWWTGQDGENKWQPRILNINELPAIPFMPCHW